jgi:rubrerythrin
MKFGLIKSKIEKKLVESYRLNQFKDELKTFRKNVLENKNISSLYFLYEELTSNKGLPDRENANDFINECIKIYETTINKIRSEELKKLMEWVGEVEEINNYETIDSLFDSNILNIEERVNSKKTIVETLIRKNIEKTNSINLPLRSFVNVANNTITKYLNTLDENSRKEIISLFSSDDDSLKNTYSTIKEEVLSKLDNLKKDTDSETLQKVDESIQKIKKENYSKLNLFRIKTLNESI